MQRFTPDVMSLVPDPDPTQTRHLQTFLGLPLFVVKLVLDLLTREDLYTFRLVSRACRHLSEPIFLHNLRLHDRNDTSARIFTQLCERLCDPEDALVEIVQEVQLGPLADIRNYPSVTILETAIRNIKDLRDFSWHMRFAIPDKILQLLHKNHPYTRIHVMNRQRNVDRQYIPPDYATLSSPQLCTLDYTAYGANERIARLEWEFSSELSAIKMCLVQAHNLKSLRLRISSDNIPRQSSWSTGPQCLSFEAGDMFPPLQDLRFEFESYDMSEKYCKQWANAMNWSQLQRLDLDGGSPSHLLAALTGKVPQLKLLSFGFREPTYTWGYPNAEIFQAFSDSIDGLEDVVASNQGAQPFNDIKDTFFSKHGHTLKRLKVSYGAMEIGWEEADVNKLAEQAPSITDVALKIATVREHSAGWPEKTMKAFEAFRHLRSLEVTLRLDVHLQLHQDSSDLLTRTHAAGGSLHFHLKEEICEEHVVSLYRRLHGDSEHPSMDCLKVNFQTNHQYNIWTFIVKSRSCDPLRFSVQKDFYNAASKRPDEVDSLWSC